VTVIGIGIASTTVMGVKKLDDLRAYQLALEFKAAVYRLVDLSDAARKDDQYKSQLFNCTASVAANIAEGWARFSTQEFGQFLRYARASLEEARVWIKDGVARRYFDQASISEPLLLADRCAATITALWRSLQPFNKKTR